MASLTPRLLSAYASTFEAYPAPPPRRSSTTSTTTTSPPAASPTSERRASTPAAMTANLHSVRTRSLGGPLSAGVIFERDPLNPPSDDDIIIVTVRISKAKSERRNSFDDPLPDR